MWERAGAPRDHACRRACNGSPRRPLVIRRSSLIGSLPVWPRGRLPPGHSTHGVPPVLQANGFWSYVHADDDAEGGVSPTRARGYGPVDDASVDCTDWTPPPETSSNDGVATTEPEPGGDETA